MKKKGKQTNSGITLIALVITIIVLLILVGVTIAMLTGDNGILTRASQASEENTHATVYESLSLEVTNYYTEKNLGKTTDNLIDYLKSKNIIDDDMVINVNNLVKQKLLLGNGNLTDGDYYRLEEVVETGKQSNELTKVASTGDIRVATTSDNTKQYKIVYYGTSKTAKWESDPINTSQENGKQSLGKLADVVEVGDYVDYNIQYENRVNSREEGVDEQIGTSWRVAYIDKENDIVKLIPEGIPLLDSDEGDLRDLLDSTVASEVSLMELEDIKKICEQSGISLNPGSTGTTDEYFSYSIEGDVLNIFNLGVVYRINTIATDWYGQSGKMYVKSLDNGKSIVEYFTGGYSYDDDNIGIRPVITLNKGIICKEGDGSKNNSYKIY